jgi:hypothetical protein
MTPQEKQALLQFMGVTYGQAVKTDRDIVAHAGNLRPVSEQLKQQFEQVMATPTQVATNPTPQWSPPQPQNMPIVAEAAAAYIPPIISTPPVVPIISSDDNKKLIKVLTNIQVALENIATILDKQPTSNVKAAKPKAKEQD